MHLSDQFLSPVVGVAMCVASTAAIAYSIKKNELSKEKLPMACAMGAFVLAVQMMNFAIPTVGSSGHITGGLLLAALIGASPALLVMSAVLIVQCICFADGGLLALGCNIFNLGVIPCLIVYPLIFKPFVKKDITPGKLMAASVFAGIVALQLGAFGVVLETYISGVAKFSFFSFAFFMQSIHLAIGVAEGIATAAILCIAYKMNLEPIKKLALAKKIAIAFAVIVLLCGGIMFASSKPDGLEWSIEKIY
jgi:cobalt/nickel transport system permease protein